MPYSNAYIDALAGPSWIDAGGDNQITFYLGDDYDLPWTDADRALFLSAFAAIEAVCNLNFVEASRETAEIVEMRVPANFPLPFEGQAWHDAPGSGQRYGYYDAEFLATYADTAHGRKAWLIMHEIGHSIGLGDPHYSFDGTGLFPGVSEGGRDDPGDNGLNHVSTTMMSNRLFAGDTQIAGPMAFDIAALQAMYGEREAATGNDTYTLTTALWYCIWDSGGIDTIAASGSAAAFVDLRQASLSNAPGGGGWQSYQVGAGGGLMIANGVVIENATGGSGNDTITGNSIGNQLTGLAGQDILKGLGGADVLIGNSHGDTLYFGNDASADRAVAGNGDTIREFDSGEDKIDVRWANASWIDITGSGTSWLVEAGPGIDIAVIGDKPLAFDILW